MLHECLVEEMFFEECLNIVRAAGKVMVMKLPEHELFQVPVENGFLDRVEDNLDVLRVNGSGEMIKEFLARISIQLFEHGEDKVGNGINVRVGTPIGGEIGRETRLGTHGGRHLSTNMTKINQS